MRSALGIALAVAVGLSAYRWGLGRTGTITAPLPPPAPVSPNAAEASSAPRDDGLGQYVLVGWNTLGMHCMNPRFRYICVLPPANTLMAQVIRRGDPPRVVTNGLKVEYSIQQNTTVAGKTDFWQYAESLFNVKLKPGVGLTGFGLSGTMNIAGDHFEATAIPVLPYNDRMVWSPYQPGVLRLKTAAGRLLGTQNVTLPVSDELHCEKCHGQYGDAGGFDSPIVDVNILRAHDVLNATTLEQQAVQHQKPVLCSQCHADAALGMSGQAGVKSLSEAMHGWHANICSDMPTCYDCHPGPKTQCNRSAIQGMGRNSTTDPACEHCHGTLADMGASVAAGRRPWVDEPTCTQCHGPNNSTDPHLYRNSTGHGGVYCAGCHNSPHAYYPSRRTQDNSQMLALQGTSFSLGKCQTCHTKPKVGDNPHVQYDFTWP